MDSNGVAMFHAEIVAGDAVHPRTTIIKVIIGKDDEDCVFPLLALHQDGITPEEL